MQPVRSWIKYCLREFADSYLQAVILAAFINLLRSRRQWHWCYIRRLYFINFQGVRRKSKNIYLSCAVTGFLSAFLNTLFFMGLLVGLFGNTEYVQGLMGGKNVILFICTFVGINAVCEMLSATVITGAVGAALYKARLLPETEKKSEKVVKTAEV